MCKVDNCAADMQKCIDHYNDLGDIEDKLTDPKAIVEDKDGNKKGSCTKAIQNSVEGALCCTPGMQQIATLITLTLTNPNRYVRDHQVRGGQGR